MRARHNDGGENLDGGHWNRIAGGDVGWRSRSRTGDNGGVDTSVWGADTLHVLGGSGDVSVGGTMGSETVVDSANKAGVLAETPGIGVIRALVGEHEGVQALRKDLWARSGLGWGA